MEEGREGRGKRGEGRGEEGTRGEGRRYGRGGGVIDYVGKGGGEMSVGVAERGVGWIHLCTSTHCPTSA